jgi:hypothetical protein
MAALSALVAVLALSAAAQTAPTSGSGSDRVDARFEVYGFAGLHVLTNRTSAVETAKGYSIATNLGTRGVAYAFIDLRSHSEVQGLVAGDKLHPEAYHAEVFRNGANRDYAVKYLNDGTVIDSTKLPPGEVAHPTSDQLRGTVDQLTAYFLLERQLARRHTCNLVVPVFLTGASFTTCASPTLSMTS